MKKFVTALASLLLCLMLLPACLAEETLRGYTKADGYVYLYLGVFPQTAEGGIEPILWRVLSVEEDAGRALLLSEYVLEARRIHGDYKEYANKPTHKTHPGFDGDFMQTEMAGYLGGEFMEHFTPGELSLIAPDEEWGAFFLLSSDDLKNKAYGFSTNKSRKAWGTDYAKENGLFVYRASAGSHSPYWTRSQSTSNTQGARCIKAAGDIGYINVITEDEGLRPACWLDLSKTVLTGGAGTMVDPYVLDVAGGAAADEFAALETPANECDCVPEGEKCDCCDCCSCSRR